MQHEHIPTRASVSVLRHPLRLPLPFFIAPQLVSLDWQDDEHSVEWRGQTKRLCRKQCAGLPVSSPSAPELQIFASPQVFHTHHCKPTNCSPGS